MDKIGVPEKMKLVETIILNGIIGYCDTYDDNDETIGIKTIKRVKRLNGEYENMIVDSFPFTKEMEDKCQCDPYQLVYRQ